ncbi:arginase family protein [Tepidanaerobacter syntrophicus]|uniref:arginase family protein n=1 Tax=Tepidanaerobacter syntrophicus TaxID=224999 RepID=UPI0023539F5F|nr:arginase family protein [Tepidanaerobacter syntrophicus]
MKSCDPVRMPINIIKVDNSLDFQEKLLKKADNIVDLTGFDKLRFCSQKSRLLEISNHLKKLPRGISFLGSSDFHHLSFSLISNLPEKISLILIDHHSDMYETFPHLISCGSWLAELIKEGKIEKCIIVGVDAGDFAIEKYSLKESNLLFITENEPEKLLISKIASQLSRIETPVYISIDKDVLRPQDAATGWDQGTMSIAGLKRLICTIKNNAYVFAVDICGEWMLPGDKILLTNEDIWRNRLNEAANLEILRALTS